MLNDTLFPAAATYFDLMDGKDKSLALECFSEDAVVHDDGYTYSGRDEILGWLTGPASEFTTTSTRLSADGGEKEATAVIRIEGDFPGGRVDLRYRFTPNETGEIATLAITAFDPCHSN